MMFFRAFLIFLLISAVSISGYAQSKNNKSGIFVDKTGVMRWQKDGTEASFFGVNYTAPFAYGYRSIQRTGVSVEQAIKDDVYHFSRLGLDAFRVHVWDVEISDSLGNLINNEHLRLFDFLIAELKKRKIKTLITPIAFWGNGYPEKDENTGSFSSKYGKQRALLEEAAFLAQERYLKQFFQHKNPYTGLTYQNDPDVIAAEVNNEPQHSGAKELTTQYVNRMVKAIRSTGWSKPIFYNISESPKYADAIVKAKDVQGYTFQWYPTGLVSGHTLKGNYLPHVSRYHIPFDTIPAFKNAAKIVYEFDAGDVLDSYMYPAMAKSFRVAGFQWATQFAYDPMATAHGNTEYQTHYLNMAYTPSKSISLLIASKAFHDLPRSKPQAIDSVFGPFRLSYAASRSEMNAEQEFYYSNTTSSKPVNIGHLQHIAGVGNSPVIQYSGTGAYFADRIADGVWRLEVMPDAVYLSDPFEKTSAGKMVTGISWATQNMNVQLPDLGLGFAIKALNKGNQATGKSVAGAFKISPGVYLLTRENLSSTLNANSIWQNIQLGEFVAPKATESPVVELFNADKDRDRIMLYNPDWKHRPIQNAAAGDHFVKFNMPALEESMPVHQDVNMSLNKGMTKAANKKGKWPVNKDTIVSANKYSPLKKEIPMLGFQVYFGDRMKSAGSTKLTGLDTLVIKARSTQPGANKIQIGLIDVNGQFFAAKIELGPDFKAIKIPLKSLKQAAQLLLPRPYPGFGPLYAQPSPSAIFNLQQTEKVEVTFEQGLEISAIYFK